MIFNTPLYELGPSSPPHENVKSIKISDAYCRNNPEYPSWLQNVSELTIYVYDSEEYKQCRFRMRLQVLEVLQSYFKNKSGINFPLSDVFETRYLRELTIDGDINIGAIFTCEDLENVFPKLVQLCLRVYGKNYAPSALRYLKRFTHGKLKSLIISSENTSECDARDSQPSIGRNWLPCL
ncbi:hypothetical protein I9W82_000752 [Candida metapsilosis]|uniref:Uncharacterized protein n=1 Tax=Candida metapsilosis TaxID=273372 RepID=A0A8H7ZH15_9ASCO|nr:hypothetical protein I9W82_000752 [Candida metapsilosis]